MDERSTALPGRLWALALALALAAGTGLHAVIAYDLPLKNLLRDAKFVLEVKIENLDAAKKRFSMSFVRELKGKLPFGRLNLTLATGKSDEVEKLLKRVRDGLLLVVFALRPDPKAKEWLFLAFSEGTWFSFSSESEAPAVPSSDSGAAAEPRPEELPPAVCRLRSLEIYLRRTFAGTTKEILDLLPDVIAGKRPAPPFDGKVPPGLGPELPPPKPESEG
jgi:hypothetical protein